MSEHLPRHRLEQLVADDPRAKIHPALRVHLAACDQCGMRKRALQAARASYLAAQPADELARSVIARAAQPERARRRRVWSLPYLFALAAGLFALAAAAVSVWFRKP